MRPLLNDYYLEVALAVAQRTTCLRRGYGAVIVKNNRIVSTGYNGAPRGAENCSDYPKRGCPRTGASGTYDTCRSVHAETNAVIQASAADMEGATLYLACTDLVEQVSPCLMCRRIMLNAGIAQMVTRLGITSVWSGWAEEMRHVQGQ